MNCPAGSDAVCNRGTCERTANYQGDGRLGRYNRGYDVGAWPHNTNNSVCHEYNGGGGYCRPAQGDCRPYEERYARRGGYTTVCNGYYGVRNSGRYYNGNGGCGNYNTSTYSSDCRRNQECGGRGYVNGNCGGGRYNGNDQYYNRGNMCGRGRHDQSSNRVCDQATGQYNRNSNVNRNYGYLLSRAGGNNDSCVGEMCTRPSN